MGLDPLSMIIELETTFAIRIPDAEAERITTVGELARYIRAQMEAQRGVCCLTSQTFYRLRRELMRVLPLPRASIRPRATLAALVPARRRRAVWAQLRAAGLDLPALILPMPVLVTGLAALLVLAYALVFWWNSPAVLVLAGLLGLLAWAAARPLAVYPDLCPTVGAAVRHLTPPPPPVTRDDPAATMSDAELLERVRGIVSAELGVPLDRVQESSRFPDLW